MKFLRLNPPFTTNHSPLSPREREVLQLLNTGLPVKQAAHHLGISVHTVNQHVRQIYLKLAVRNRVMALNRARQLGLLEA
jgi:two-component system nitrate/nitrite response regulator NarL